MPVNVTKLSEVFNATVADRLSSDADAQVELSCCPNTVTFRVKTIFGSLNFEETKLYNTIEWSEFEGQEDEVAGGIAISLCELVQRRIDRYSDQYRGGSDG